MKNLLSMKTPVLALFISLVAFGACVSNKQTQPSTDYTQLVNPFIGTDFTGNTYPGPYFRLFLSGQYDCRIQSYPFVGDGSRRLV